MEECLVVADFRSALQEATAPLHDRIDALFGAFDLADCGGLARFLVAQAIGMAACQPRVARFGRESLGCDAPDYNQVLTRDLAMLGVDAAHLPCFALAGELGNAGGDAWADAGVFYVVAGSRMGAAVLRDRAIAPMPGGPAHGVCGFFAVGEGPAMWRLFRIWLGREAGAGEGGLPAMIEAAKATFELFARAGQWAAAQPDLARIDQAAGAGREGFAA